MCRSSRRHEGVYQCAKTKDNLYGDTPFNVAHKIFTTKEEKKAIEKSRKTLEKASNGSKKVGDSKKKDKGTYKGPNGLSAEQLESYHKDNKCL